MTELPQAPERPPEVAGPTESVEVSQRYSVAQPQGVRAYPIAVATWERLKRDIQRIAPPLQFFQPAGWLCAGAAVSLAISIFVPTGLSAIGRVITWAALVCLVILAVAFLIVDSRQRKTVSKSAEIVVEEMCETEKMFDRDNN
jgi:hypothetical protein